jgi:hypothetical protein
VNNVGLLGGPGAAAGYVWAHDPTAPWYVAAPFYGFNSTGGTNTITRQGVGD